jgi:hypothetical protein
MKKVPLTAGLNKQITLRITKSGDLIIDTNNKDVPELETV